MNIEWNSIKIGDKVRMKWNGYARVPKWLSGDWAVVIDINKRGNLVVIADSESGNFARSLQPWDVSAHAPQNKEELK